MKPNLIDNPCKPIRTIRYATLLMSMVQIHYGYLFDFSLLCVFKRSLKKSALDDAKSHTFLGGCIVTLVAFVWLFSTVRSQMSPQIACSRECRNTLVAFVWLFSTVCFKCVLKLPAWTDAKSHWLHLFDFSPLCVFKCVLKWSAREDAYSHW